MTKVAESERLAKSIVGLVREYGNCLYADAVLDIPRSEALYVEIQERIEELRLAAQQEGQKVAE